MSNNPISGIDSPTQQVINAAVQKSSTETQINTALLAKAQDIQKQQGEAALSLIAAASPAALIDVRA
jgi:hypothetical protein